MKKSELKKDVKVWCWWKSRTLYYTGKVVRERYQFKVVRERYQFVDASGLLAMIDEEQLKELEVIV